MAIALKEPKNGKSIWITTAGAAALAKVSKTTARNWRVSGKISSIEVDDGFLLSRFEVDDWIAQRNIATDILSSVPGIGPVITSTEAARYLQVTPARINQWIREGRIEYTHEVYVNGGNNGAMRAVLVSKEEIDCLRCTREANGVVNDPGDSVPADKPCPIPLERLISSQKAADLLGVNVTNLAAWRMAGRIKFDIKRRRQGPGQVLGTFYDREELEKCKKERDVITSLEEDTAWMRWRELAEFTGIPQCELRGYIRSKTLPYHSFPLGRREFAYYHKPEIKKWLKERDGKYAGFDATDLLHTTQAAVYTGFSAACIGRHIKDGNLKYKYHRKNTIPVVLSDKGKIDGRGFWFEKDELDRWKDWMWDRLLSTRSWRGRLLRNLHTKFLKDGERTDLVMPYQNAATAPDNEVIRTPQIADPVAKKKYQASLVDSGEISVDLAEALESQIINTLESEDVVLTPHDLYQLVMCFRHVKEQWSILKERGIPVPENAGERLQQTLSLVSKRAKDITESGFGMSADDTYYLTQATRYVQQELLRRDRTEVADTGENADDLFAIVDTL